MTISQLCLVTWSWWECQCHEVVTRHWAWQIQYMYTGLPSVCFSTTSHSNISYELEVTFLSPTVLVFDTKREAIGLNFSGGFNNEVVLPRWALAAVGLNPHLPHHQISISRISKTILYSCRSMALTNHWLFCSGKNFKSLFMSMNFLSHVFLFESLSLPSLDGGRTLSRVFLANNQITHRTYLHRG